MLCLGSFIWNLDGATFLGFKFKAFPLLHLLNCIEVNDGGEGNFDISVCIKKNPPSMHSSRMHTGCSLTASHSIWRKGCHACMHAHPYHACTPCHAHPHDANPPRHTCPPTMHAPCHTQPPPPHTPPVAGGKKSQNYMFSSFILSSTVSLQTTLGFTFVQTRSIPGFTSNCTRCYFASNYTSLRIYNSESVYPVEYKLRTGEELSGNRLRR